MPLHASGTAPASVAAIAVMPALPAAPIEPYLLAKTTAVRWDYIVFFAALHLVALLVFVPYFFTWPGFATFVIGVLVFGQLAIPIGYHRLLAHKSFQCSKWFERTLVTLAMCTAQENAGTMGRLASTTPRSFRPTRRPAYAEGQLFMVTHQLVDL